MTRDEFIATLGRIHPAIAAAAMTYGISDDPADPFGLPSVAEALALFCFTESIESEDVEVLRKYLGNFHKSGGDWGFESISPVNLVN